MTEEEILNLIGLDCSSYSLEELTNLRNSIVKEIKARNAIIKIIFDAIKVNISDLNYSQKVVDGRIRVPVFPLRENEYPEAIKMEIETQQDYQSYHEKVREVLVAKLNEVKDLMKKYPSLPAKE